MQGPQTHEWDGRNANGVALAPGMYTFKIEIEGRSVSGKVILKAKN